MSARSAMQDDRVLGDKTDERRKGILPRVTGAHLFQAGFRPFFLAAGVLGALAIPLWLAYFSGHLTGPAGLDALLWHSHEMLFGFVPAAIAGFLLTAIPNWTGRLPLKGSPLFILFALWCLGRLAWLASGALDPWLVAAIDLSFLGLLWLVTLREVVAGKNWRNLLVLVPVGLLFAANILFHLESTGLAEVADLGLRLGLGVVAFLVMLIGGRVTPSFTRNWLAKRKETKLPVSANGFDKGVMAVTALSLVLWIALPDLLITGFALLLAGILLFVRLSRWRGLAVAQDSLLLVLHLGYAWLAFSFVLLGLSLLSDELALPLTVPYSAALHAFTAGAFANMILAVMCRAALGHSGMALKADSWMTLGFVALAVAALLRVIAGWEPTTLLFGLSGLLWTLAFVVFIGRFWGAFTRRPTARS
ncbi:NnrS family protein [Rhodovibrionaceae bacterium A322]